MADLARKGIPDEAGHVFGEALILLVQWKGGAEEPTVMLDGQLLRISYAAVGLAAKCVRLNMRRLRGTGSANRKPCPNLMPRERTRLR
jgi:hypothetical protein